MFLDQPFAAPAQPQAGAVHAHIGRAETSGHYEVAPSQRASSGREFPSTSSPDQRSKAKLLVSDDLRAAIVPRSPPVRPKPEGGRPPIPDRAALTGILFVLKAGLRPWEYLPAEMGCGSGRGMESEDFSDGFHIEHMR